MIINMYLVLSFIYLFISLHLVEDMNTRGFSQTEAMNYSNCCGTYVCHSALPGMVSVLSDVLREVHGHPGYSSEATYCLNSSC